MRRHAGTIICVAVILFLIGIFVIWPAIDEQLARIPMTDGISALRSRNVAALRTSFTPDATLTAGSNELQVTALLDIIAPRLSGKADEELGSFHFAGYSNAQRHGRTMEADFKIVFEMPANDDNPYRVNPTVEKTGQIVLKKQGLFSWKIQRLSFKDDRLNGILKHLGELSPAGGH